MAGDKSTELYRALKCSIIQALSYQRTKFPSSRAGSLWQRGCGLSVSAANGAHALAVLVVEDDFFVRYDIAGCLREAGYAVIESESGEEALALCKSGMSIDMIVTDINLGGSASGWDVAKRFRSEQPDMPVVYISGEQFDSECCVPGSVFVAKPYQHIDILSACQRLRK
jgi:CheY-like chemotaxis protein